MRPLLIFLLISFSITISAQDTIQPVCAYPEQLPEFPGGEMAMVKFIQTHLEYPIHMDTQGRVVVGFVVNEDGSVSDIVIKRGLCKQADAEAIRVVKLFPQFKPGMQNGKPVRTRFVLPFIFKIASD